MINTKKGKGEIIIAKIINTGSIVGMEKITSTSNAKVQEIKKLLDSKKDRYLLQKFVAEGVNIVKDIPNKYIDSLFMTVETFEKYKRWHLS